QEAVDRVTASRESYDLILMDVQMPVMDGYQATQKLRELGFRSPIIAVTAYALSRDLKRAMAAGCNDFITKPLVPAQLIRKVGHWLSSQGSHGKMEAKAEAPGISHMVNDEKFRPILLKFLKGLPGRMEAIEAAVADGRDDELLALVHQLKGSAGSYGFPRISELSRECQDLLRAKEKTDVLDSQLSALLRELRHVSQEAKTEA
ncbi:MAG: response regulator, partial [Myxococcota bacterium]|nr:response regulator [Myxococcota bacterium]